MVVKLHNNNKKLLERGERRRSGSVVSGEHCIYEVHVVCRCRHNVHVLRVHNIELDHVHVINLWLLICQLPTVEGSKSTSEAQVSYYFLVIILGQRTREFQISFLKTVPKKNNHNWKNYEEVRGVKRFQHPGVGFIAKGLWRAKRISRQRGYLRRGERELLTRLVATLRGVCFSVGLGLQYCANKCRSSTRLVSSGSSLSLTREERCQVWRRKFDKGVE